MSRSDITDEFVWEYIGESQMLQILDKNLWLWSCFW
jgi:hypothetical protein